MSAGGSVEVAALRRAETEALQTVQQAREERKLRLKQANDDAAAEIAAYEKGELERLDRLHPKRDVSDEFEGMRQRTDESIATVQKEFEQNKNDAIKLLMHVTTTVQRSAAPPISSS